MFALLTAAWALECGEVANMDKAGVPVEEIVRQMNVSGTPIDVEFVSCLAAHGIEGTLINSAWRLEGTRPERSEPLQYDLDVTTPGWVELDMTCGAVTIEGVAERRVELSGMGAKGARLVTTPSPKGARIVVEGPSALDGSKDPADIPRFDQRERPKPHPAERPCADLNITVPRDSRVVVKSTRADVRILHVDGPLEVTTHFGNMDIVGRTEELALKTASGRIHADTGARHVDVETVSGQVEVGLGPEARVTATSISGPLWLWGGPVQRLNANSVSGDIRLNAAIMDTGNVTLVTHKGNVEGVVPSGEVAVSSHEGKAFGPARMVRPDGPTQRVGKSPVAPQPVEGFTGLEALDAQMHGVWSKSRPERWWFRSGAVLSSVVEMKGSGYSMEASSFSGDVRVRTAEQFPGSTGPVIAGLEAVNDRLQACADAQHRRTPKARGHAVLTIQVGITGEVVSLVAPAKSDTDGAVADGKFSACLTRAVDALTFPEGAATELRWPVPFHPPIVIERLPEPGGALPPQKRPLNSRRVPQK